VEDIEEERAVAAIFTDAAAIISAGAMAAAVIKISQEEDGPEHKNYVLFGRFLLLFLSVYIPLVCNLSIHLFCSVSFKSNKALRCIWLMWFFL
jgi:hypothetical protein